MTKAAYSEKLKHPLWQRKRLEVLDRAGFSCEFCGCEEEMLHVHHKYYEKGKEPWDYPDNAFVCLCKKCHESRHEEKEEIASLLSRLDDDRKIVIGYLKGRLSIADPMMPMIELQSWEEAAGLSDAYNLEVDAVLANTVDGCINTQVLRDLSNPILGKYLPRIH